MKIYSTHRNKQNQQANTFKHEVMVNWQRVDHQKNSRRKKTEREKSAPDSWTALVAKRIEILGEKLSGFFYPEVVE